MQKGWVVSQPLLLHQKKDCLGSPFNFHMAERVGFEPTVPCDITGFQDQLLKPLGHLSIAILV